MRMLWMVLALVMTGCAGTAPALSTGPDSGRTVEALVQAYADRNLEAMAALFHPDIEWMSVQGARIERVARGRAEMRALMAENLESNPDARWRLVSAQPYGAYVAATERAEWDGGAASMENVVVYEVRDGLVRRVWFYPPAQGLQ